LKTPPPIPGLIGPLFGPPGVLLAAFGLAALKPGLGAIRFLLFLFGSLIAPGVLDLLVFG
jgi:hypothetical protein